MTDASRALEAGQPQLHPEAPNNLIFDWQIGDETDTDKAIAAAAHVTEITIHNNRLSPNPMEPRAGSMTPATTTTPATRPARTRMWRGW